MERLSTKRYDAMIAEAIRHFWNTRDTQLMSRKQSDQGTRSAVTGGKQLDGLVKLLVQVALDMGIPKSCIHSKKNQLPGFFRPSKDWDFVITSPSTQLIAVVEFKSQVGSFGNNFNNRTEEALGSAVDLWTTFREDGFQQKQQPWLGYMMLVEHSGKSSRPVRVHEPHFKVRPEFQKTNYLERYCLFCQKLMQERHYTSTAMIWTNSKLEFGCMEEDISITSFLMSFMGFLQGKLNEFEQ